MLQHSHSWAWAAATCLLASLISSASALQNLAVVRPFAPSDAARLVGAFDSWNEFPPCKEPPAVAVDLFLCFSQDVDASPDISDALTAITTDFYHQSKQWHLCFRSLQWFSAHVAPDKDRYLKGNEVDGWVSGPNLQFLAIARAFEKNNFGEYDAWFLMEMDNIPRRPLWLGALLAEVEAKQPFAVVGSHYRGDMWERSLGVANIRKEMLFHINGNAVYNHTNPHLRAMMNAFEEAMHNGDKKSAFDIWMAKYCLERGITAQQIGYWGNSAVVGNYAGTVMTDAYCQNEFLVHGGFWYDEWDASKPLSIVVSDWGISDEEGVPMLTTWTRALLAGRHPIRHVIVVRPAESTVTPQYEMKTTMGDVVSFREVPRTKDSGWDWCAAPVATDYFTYSSVYFSHHIRADILVARNSGRIAAWHMPGGSVHCSAKCEARLQRASTWMGRKVTRHYDETHMVFHTAIRNAFCSTWEASPMRSTVGSKPHVDEYMAFAEEFNGGKTYEYVSSLKQWFRPQAVLNETLIAAATPKFRIQTNEEHAFAANATNQTTTTTQSSSSWAPYVGLAALAVIPAAVVAAGVLAATGALGTAAATTPLAAVGLGGSGAFPVPPPTPALGLANGAPGAFDFTLPAPTPLGGLLL